MTAIRSPRPSSRLRGSILGLLALAALASLAACGDDERPAAAADRPAGQVAGSKDDTSRPRPTTTVRDDDHDQDDGSDDGAAPTTDMPADGAPSGSAVSSLDGVRHATVRIEAQGTFVDPEFGEFEGAGSGSGFVIDPSGIAVTNNHVVVGAGLLQVHIDGETRPRNARVLGVSECSDLAVIKIEGAELPYLDWYDGSVEPGLDVYAAGYPLGDPEFTLTRGIVAKARAFGDTDWASIDNTIEHDANIQPGNSGGPLVDADGRVVGVDYASANFTNQSQFFAISASDARPIVDVLREGTDVDSIGINAQAVVSDDGSISGIWVAGVAAGSVADKTGIRPGDIVTRMAGVTMAVDGTMRDYCDVLRSHAPDAPIAVEVLRFATSEVLHGQLNGPELTQSFSFADAFADDAGSPADPAGGYTDYVAVVDDTGSITVTVPVEWSDVDGAPIDLAGDGSSPAASLSAAPDLVGFTNTWSTPGVEFIAGAGLAELSPAELLDLLTQDECTSDGRSDYDDGAFAGQFELFADCGGTDSAYIVVATHSVDGSIGVLVAVQVVTDADLEALDVILSSFNVA